MLKTLRIGATVCAVLAGLTLSFTLLFSNSFAKDGGVVIRKYVSASDAVTQFRLDCRLQSGGEYNSVYSRHFYDEAQVGDYLEFPLNGYTRLLRDGHVISRNFSDEFIVPLVYSLIALLPSTLFARVAQLRFHRVLYVVVGLIEVAVISLPVYSFFAPCC